MTIHFVTDRFVRTNRKEIDEKFLKRLPDIPLPDIAFPGSFGFSLADLAVSKDGENIRDLPAKFKKEQELTKNEIQIDPKCIELGAKILRVRLLELS